MSLMRLFLLLMLPAALSAATRVESYAVQLHATPEGSGQGMVALSLTDCAPGLLVVPLGFSAPEDLRIEEAPTGVRLEPGPRNGMTSLHFHFPEGMPAKATLRFSFTVKQVFQVLQLAPGEKSTLPKGSRIFRHAFVNTQETPIGLYRLELLFPEGFMAQAIREQLPKPKKHEAGPRVLLSKTADHQAASLQFTDLRQGDDTSMALELVPTQRSVGWLLAGLLLGGIYLFKFKDLVAEGRSAPTA
jgi:hypothetical protein